MEGLSKGSNIQVVQSIPLLKQLEKIISEIFNYIFYMYFKVSKVVVSNFRVL